MSISFTEPPIPDSPETAEAIVAATRIESRRAGLVLVVDEPISQASAAVVIPRGEEEFGRFAGVGESARSVLEALDVALDDVQVGG